MWLATNQTDKRGTKLRGVVSQQFRMQNSQYFCAFKYARAIKQKVWNEAENRERDWGERPYGRVRLARFTPRFTDFFTDFNNKKTDCFAVYFTLGARGFSGAVSGFGQVLKSDFTVHVFGLRQMKRHTKRSSLSHARKNT